MTATDAAPAKLPLAIRKSSESARPATCHLFVLTT